MAAEREIGAAPHHEKEGKRAVAREGVDREERRRMVFFSFRSGDGGDENKPV